MKSNHISQRYLSELQTRRRFLRRAVCAAAGTAAMSNVLRDLRFMNAAIAQTAISDYKALICVFLNGGNDSNNMIIPIIPSEWQSYAAIRTSALAIPNTDGGPATALKLKNPTAGGGTDTYMDAQGHNYGFHPAMKELGGDYTNAATLSTTPGLFNTGKCAVLLNVGSLSFPLTKAQYTSGAVPKPPQLFSHSDQQSQWQTSIPDQPQNNGWGGRVADIMTAPPGGGSNVNLGGQISMAVTLAGSNIFEVGNQNLAPQYSVSTTGAVKLSTGITGSTNLNNAFQSILSADAASPDLQTKAYAGVLSSAITEATTVSNAITALGSPAYLSRFPADVVTPNGGATVKNSSLMAQMKMVAQLIDIGKNQLGMKRQIFFIQVGGYDTHTVQTQSSASGNFTNANVVIGSQAQLLAELSQTLNALYLAMGDLGIQNKVTAFSVSDFSRTFPSNGSGSDHGWGGHHVVVGGAVNGGAIYGKLPTLTVNGPDDTGTGRWIPTTSVDQYAATLATWFGVDAANLSTIFPNLARFASPNLLFI